MSTPIPPVQQRIKIPNATPESPDATIPVLGLGTWQSPPGQVKSAVEYALKEAGFRHIDAAWAYGNEKEVGEGIRASGVPRSEIFLTSKIWATYMGRVAENLELILANLDTDYLDLLLIHWPFALNPEGKVETTGPRAQVPFREKDGKPVPDVVEDWDLTETWRQMEGVQMSGKVRHIGMSNFSEMHLRTILVSARIKPALDQLELHPYNPQHKLRAFLAEHGILAAAYSPLGSTNSTLLKDDAVLEIAAAHGGAEPAQILLGWLVTKGIVALPKSVTPARILSNSKPVTLTQEQVERLDALAGPGGKQHRFVRPNWGARLGFEDWDWAIKL